MVRIKSIQAILIILAAVALASCEKKYADSGDDDNGNGGNKIISVEKDSDYVWDNTAILNIVLSGTTGTINPDYGTVEGSKITVKKAGTYNVTGSLTDGQIVVNTNDAGAVKLILNGVNINCLSSAPIYVKEAAKAVIILNAGTQNYLTDGTSYVTDNNEPSATLFSNSYLSIYGDGALNITAKYNDGISGDDGLVIKSGTISVTSADDGIRGKDYLEIHDGNITVNSTGDGLKSENATDATLGFITIDHGTINITTTSGDAVNAQTKLTVNDGTFNIKTGGGAVITTGGGGGPGGGGSSGYSGTYSEKAFKSTGNLVVVKGSFTINSADDAFHSNSNITITDGTFNISSGDDALHANSSIVVNGGTISILKSYESMESPSITINSGNISMVSADDSFNATKGVATEANDGSCLFINGGNILVNATGGDGIDSNGNVVMAGGTVIVHGPQSSPEVGIDVNGSFNISGGLLLASGPNSGNMIEAVSTTSAQNCIKVTISGNLASATLFHIEDGSGNYLVTYKPVRSLYYIVFSSPALTSGSSFSIYSGGSCTGTLANGIYTNGTYSGGTLKKTFSVSSRVTNISY